MKDYLLISNTKENKIGDFYLDFVSSHIEKSTNKTISYRELSYRKAYEWELPSNKYDSKLEKIMSDFQSNSDLVEASISLFFPDRFSEVSEPLLRSRPEAFTVLSK